MQLDYNTEHIVLFLDYYFLQAKALFIPATIIFVLFILDALISAMLSL